MGFTIPSDPDAEKHALDAGFDHVVVEVGDAAEILLALSGPGALLVSRGRDAAYAFATAMIGHAHARLRQHPNLMEPYGRRRNIAVLRRTIETIHQSVRNAGLDGERAEAVQAEVAALERQFERLVRSGDGQPAAP